jgi:archaellum component FlaG (FlaF/FlaG flagellin family)
MGPKGEPNLKFLHAEGALNRVKLDVFRRLSASDLKASLAPGQNGSLKVRVDGTVLDGHHRLTVLVERGENIDRLPREIIDKEP